MAWNLRAIIGGGVVAAGLVITAGLVAAPATAEIGPTAPSAEARHAAEEVHGYVNAHPRPQVPESASRAALSAHAEQLHAFLSGFPWEAGFAQWECSLITEVDVTLHPETADLPAYAGSSYGSRCGEDGLGYAPTSEEILAPRLH